MKKKLKIMPYRFLYLDDDIEQATILKDGLETTGLIKVSVLKPTHFEEQVQELITKQKQFDGLILDLKLDGNLKGDRIAKYNASSLAQQIRSKVKEGVWKNEFPIILLTSQENLKVLYEGDTTSHDLFDFRFYKSDIKNVSFQKQLHALVDAYKAISKVKPDVAKMLGIKNIESLDSRIFSRFDEGAATNDYARYILKELIFASGPLINENILAARLGIEIMASKDWPNLKDQILDKEKYKGIYSTAWERWWMFKINDWWESKITNENPLAALGAEDRIRLLIKKTKLSKLKAAEPLPKAASSKFWTICKALEAPLDPKDGLRISGKEPFPWQDLEYISIEAALERVASNKIRIHPMEKKRFEDIKTSFS